MIVVIVILGLIGLGIVVLVHELGHFGAARASGVEVEAFSIGWGPKLFGWKKGGTEWRISVFPIGGFCKMKGEEAFAAAIQNKSETIPREPGTFYGAPAWKRILISLAGPVANLIFAAIVFVVVSAVGYTEKTYGNRIVLASEFRLDGNGALAKPPADAAGLETGDSVTAINGKTIRDYSDLQQAIALSPGKPLTLGIDRGGSAKELTVTPLLDKDSGAGRIGIYSWIPPLVAKVEPNSAAAIGGIKAGDLITSVNGLPVRHGIEALSYLADRPEKASIGVDRKGVALVFPLVLSYGSNGANLGISFATMDHVVRSSSIGAAFSDGLAETWKTFSVSIQGLGLLFRGVNILKAISGPARITYLVGRTATEGLAQNGPEGLVLVFNFLAFLSIALFIMNLLPIPSLDGGMILMFIIETIRRRALRTRTIYRFQFIGMTFILALFVLSAVSDLFWFTGK
jgi:regulator of sigma E protease